MKEFLFYISGAIAISSSLMMAFSYSAKNSLKYFAYFTAGTAGLMLILNSQLYSALLILVLLLLFSAANLLNEKLSKYTEYIEEPQSRLNLISIVMLSAFTAVLAGAGGTAKWKIFEIDYSVNTYGLIFTKYMPALLVIALLTSVIFSSAVSLKSGEGANE